MPKEEKRKPGRPKKEHREYKFINTPVSDEAFDIYKDFPNGKKGYHVSRALIRYVKKQKKKE
jgi:hypothetical protein